MTTPQNRSTTTLSVISKRSMELKLEEAIGKLRSLHNLAVDKSVRKNLKRAMSSAESALKVFVHHNVKPFVEPKMANPQKANYQWHR